MGIFCFFKANVKVVNIEFILNDFSDRFMMIMVMNASPQPFT